MKFIEKMKGYKTTDVDGKCMGYQYSLPKKKDDGTQTPGDWHEFEGDDIKLCSRGFHFCVYPSGVYSYYKSDCRVFEIEAEMVLVTPDEAGADLKKVCKRIKLTKEIFPAVDRNTGECNTGDRNTGYGNTGNCNTGYGNTGYRNTGNCNTGHRNTGYYNTGDRNAGDCNTGECNTGNCNTGNCNTGGCNTGDYNTGYRNTGGCNTGYRNTGDYNTGDYNTGYGNCCDKSSGHFNTRTPQLIMFDKPVKDESEIDNEKICDLALALQSNDPFDYENYLDIPNATVAKIKKLHKMHIQKRREV